MKTLVSTSKFAPHAGGTAVVWTEWCRYWPAQDLTVIAPRLPGCEAFDRAQAYRVIRCSYPDVPKIRMPWLWLHQGVRCSLEAWRRPPELVHYGHIFENGWIGPWLGRPYMVHTYAEELVLARRLPWLRRLVGRVLEGAVGVTAISRFTQAMLADFGYHGDSLLVHPGVDLEVYRPGSPQGLAQSKFAVPPGPMLFTCGRLIERKGHDTVIRVLPQLLAEFADLQYVIAGVGPHEAELRRLIGQLGLEGRVHLLGRVDDGDLPALLREATLFVHPSRVTGKQDVEGFGIVFLEAAACRLAVVGGNSGGIVDAVQDGVNGVLVDDERDLLEQLRRLLGDGGLRQRMADAGPAWAEGFAWRHAAARVWDYSLSRLSRA